MTRRGRQGLGVAMVGAVAVILGLLIALAPATQDSVAAETVANLTILGGILAACAGFGVTAWSLIRD